MRVVGYYFRWLARPQLLMGFVVICLCIGALAAVDRAVSHGPLAVAAGRPNVKGLYRPAFPVPDCAVVACMALTFDDGPNSSITPRVLDILAREQIQATFFVVGERIASREHLLVRMHAEGHEIGNHSWNHPMFTTLSPADMENQLRMAQRAIMAAGVPAPNLFRPPYGAVDSTVMGHTTMTVVRWNIDPLDWKLKDAQKVTEQMIAQARPGGVVLLHDSHATTADALEPAIRELKSHYQFVTVSQLLNVAPGDRGLYFGRQ